MTPQGVKRQQLGAQLADQHRLRPRRRLDADRHAHAERHRLLRVFQERAGDAVARRRLAKLHLQRPRFGAPRGRGGGRLAALWRAGGRRGLYVSRRGLHQLHGAIERRQIHRELQPRRQQDSRACRRTSCCCGSATINRTGASKGLGGFVQFRWQDGYFIDNANLIKAPGYELVNLNVHYNVDLVTSTYFKSAMLVFRGAQHLQHDLRGFGQQRHRQPQFDDRRQNPGSVVAVTGPDRSTPASRAPSRRGEVCLPLIAEGSANPYLTRQRNDHDAEGCLSDQATRSSDCLARVLPLAISGSLLCAAADRDRGHVAPPRRRKRPEMRRREPCLRDASHADIRPGRDALACLGRQPGRVGRAFFRSRPHVLRAGRGQFRAPRP